MVFLCAVKMRAVKGDRERRVPSLSPCRDACALANTHSPLPTDACRAVPAGAGACRVRGGGAAGVARAGEALHAGPAAVGGAGLPGGQAAAAGRVPAPEAGPGALLRGRPGQGHLHPRAGGRGATGGAAAPAHHHMIRRQSASLFHQNSCSVRRQGGQFYRKVHTSNEGT